MTYSVYSDKELLLRLQQGDHSAFDIIYDLYKRRLAGNLLRLLKSDELVDDVLQELFANVWQHRKNIDTDRPIKSYLFQIGRNLCVDIFRRAARDQVYFQYLKENFEEGYMVLEETLIKNEQPQLLEKAISTLSPQRQNIFRLCRLEGKSYKEVAKILGISTATINAHITIANKQVRDYVLNNKDIVYIALTVLTAQDI
ncbi:RNA polymerase sigma factor [Sphingobacterium yanglingense]|uniref:RNA polymerase sigma-70 factor (ECF subfamily) n=1 Tax=Sphingobacterium yanglingense TaxID=1437280 RepID=A0A4R6W503_9SPHI|nr:sigma-70 family RNA polymerase sigma factor [Sphingobacterium yanglingense]TDQ73818.1 RNA polymerase sigma-70 factor (ECF subfamily) [Sphingobacterium yanglingense]